MDVDQSGTTSSQRPDIFTVICREVPFRLTRSQIESDSPNYFTTAFLDGGFAESNSKIIHLDQHPRLFSLIVEHLSGYPILPLQPSTIPSFLSIEMAQESLLRDAQYFGLEGLQKAFAAYLPAPPPSPSMPETLRQRYNFDKIIEIERLIGSGDLKLTTDSSSVGIVGDTGEVLIRARNVPVRFTMQRKEYLDAHEEKQLMPCIAARIRWPHRRLHNGGHKKPYWSIVLDDDAQFTLNSTPMAAHSLLGLFRHWAEKQTTPQTPKLDVYWTDPEATEDNVRIEDESQDPKVPTLDVMAKSLVFKLWLDFNTLGNDYGDYEVRWMYADVVDAETWSIPQWNEAMRYLDQQQQ